jgi:hypothetical protein
MTDRFKLIDVDPTSEPREYTDTPAKNRRARDKIRQSEQKSILDQKKCTNQIIA